MCLPVSSPFTAITGFCSIVQRESQPGWPGHTWGSEGLTMLPVELSFIFQECLQYLQSRQCLTSRTGSQMWGPLLSTFTSACGTFTGFGQLTLWAGMQWVRPATSSINFLRKERSQRGSLHSSIWPQPSSVSLGFYLFTDCSNWLVPFTTWGQTFLILSAQTSIHSLGMNRNCIQRKKWLTTAPPH